MVLYLLCFTLVGMAAEKADTLVTLARNNDLAKIKERGDAGLNDRDVRTGETSLHIACEHGYKDLVTYLCERRCIALNCQKIDGSTPLLVAIKKAAELKAYERWEIVRILLKKKPDVTIADNEGLTPLHAVLFLEITIFRELIDAGALALPIWRPLTATGEIRWSRSLSDSLQAEWNRVDTIKKAHLLDFFTAIAEARDIIDLQRINPSSPQLLSIIDRDAQALSVGNTNQQFINAIRRNIPLNSDKETSLESLLNYVNVNCRCRERSSWTPVHYAVALGRVDVVDWLLQKGAHLPIDAHVIASCIVRQPDGNYSAEYVLTRAESEKRVDAPASLDDSGILGFLSGVLWGSAKQELSADDNEPPNTLICIAKRNSYGDMVTRLEAYKALREVSSVTKVEAALNKGLFIDVRFEDGITPLHYASKSGEREVVRLLCQRGASVDLQDTSGNTALSYALLYKKTEIIDLLVQLGASIKKAIEPHKENQKVLGRVKKYIGDTPCDIVQLKAGDVVNAIFERAVAQCKPITDSSRCFNYRLVAALLDIVDVNRMYGSYKTAIHEALRLQNLELFNVLSHHPSCNPNLNGPSGASPLMYLLQLVEEDHTTGFADLNSLADSCAVDQVIAQQKPTYSRDFAIDVIRVLASHQRIRRATIAGFIEKALVLGEHWLIHPFFETETVCNKIDRDQLGNNPLFIRYLQDYGRCNVCFVENTLCSHGPGR